MSVMSTKDISLRIRKATFDSPIAVFLLRAKNTPDRFNAVFSNTVWCHRRTLRKDETIMGIFWGHHGQLAWDFLIECRT